MKKKFKHLIVIGHPDHKSFCYNGIFKTIVDEVDKKSEDFKIIDLSVLKSSTLTFLKFSAER